jgi:[ribosomal protein S18]-alanine N-acetyltransferase
VSCAIRELTGDDQAFLTEMQYAAFFVPPGAEPYPRSILDEPSPRLYHVGFGERPGDVGVLAIDPDGRPLGAAWVRLVEGGYGQIDDATPELGIAVVDDMRGCGVGTRLLEALLERVPRCSLSVDVRNPAKRLYERFGFDVVRLEGEHTAVMLHDSSR